MKHPVTSIFRKKTRRYIVAAPCAPGVGIQWFSFVCEGDGFEARHLATFPYSGELSHLLSNADDNLASLALAENLFSSYLAETAILASAHLPRSFKTDAAIVSELIYAKRRIPGSEQSAAILCGGEFVLAQKLKIPVAGSFIAASRTSDKPGYLPLNDGDRIIAAKAGGLSVFLNIGQSLRITVTDPLSGQLADEESIHGLRHSDAAAKLLGIHGGIDRDGLTAKSGTADPRTVDVLLKQLDASADLDPSAAPIAADPALSHLCAEDKIATITAFIAVAASMLYKKAFPADRPAPHKIWISGGGVGNQALVTCLKSYFSPLEITETYSLGIPENNRYAIALALGVDSWIKKAAAGKAGLDSFKGVWHIA